MTHLGLFEGIGGFSLAAKWMGWQTLAWCEKDKFCQQVLAYHFPNAIGHGDIFNTDFTPYANKITLLTGGFPCQPFSAAGKRKGTNDDRHLWPQMLRAIQEINPIWVIAENVFGLTNIDGGLVFEQVCLDLENAGYEVQTFVIPAAAKGAPHRRDRVWFVAYSDSNSKRQVGDSKNNEGEQSTSIHTEGQRGYRRAFFDSRFCNLQGNVTDTYGHGLNKRNFSNEINTGKRGEYAFGNSCKGYSYENVTDSEGETNRKLYTESKRRKNRQSYIYGKIGNAANTISKGLQRRLFDRSLRKGGKKQYKLAARCVRSNWEKFPTQPPICSGNDGLPRQLDGITFPKWRTESIRAYGNAIVPQVAFTLYQVIEKINKEL
jgi:DNA (cytosine-5)-methyltransferase 1